MENLVNCITHELSTLNLYSYAHSENPLLAKHPDYIMDDTWGQVILPNYAHMPI
jgi:hypothetical protein